MDRCTSCGRELPEGANFCEHCGPEASAAGADVYALKDPASGPLFEVPIREYLRTGWQTFWQYPAAFIGFSLIIMLAMGILITVQRKLPLIGFLLAAAITPLYAGIYIVSAKLLQRQTCTFSDFFSGFHYFQPLVIFGLIFGILGGIGQLFLHYLSLFLLVSLVSLGLRLLLIFTPFLIIDRRLGLWEAMELSLRTVKRRWPQFLGFIFLGGLLVVAGVIALGIGVLVTFPWVLCAFTAAYADLFGLQSKEY
jgi:uncharacterized membrane protein